MNIVIKNYNKNHAPEPSEIVVTVEYKNCNTMTDTLSVDNVVNMDTTSISNITTSTVITEKSLEETYSCVFEWQIYCGDFGIDQLYYLNDLCEEYDIPMEVMLSIACTESSFCSAAQSSTSSASGYFQIIKSTAEWVYENLLNYGTYDTDEHGMHMITDWKLNMELACKLMDHLYENNNHSWDVAICRYHGSTDNSANISYLNKVNKNMYELFGITTSNFN